MFQLALSVSCRIASNLSLASLISFNLCLDTQFTGPTEGKDTTMAVSPKSQQFQPNRTSEMQAVLEWDKSSEAHKNH